MDSGSVGQLCTIGTTPYGGRGVYAQMYIKAGTCVQHCPAPYAYVIARKFRKEVCAWCFKYAFEHGKNTWGWKYDVTLSHPSQVGGIQDQNTGKLKRKEGESFTNFASVSFCSMECRNSWCLEMDVGGLHAALNVTLEKLAISDKERRTLDGSGSTMQSISQEIVNDTVLRTIQRHWLHSTHVLLSSVDRTKGSSIVNGDSPITATCQTLSHQEQLNEIWAEAEHLYGPNKLRLRHFQPHRKEQLTEFELDTARFVISALLRRFSEECTATGGPWTQRHTNCDSPGEPGVTWSDMLELQNNEVETALRKPEIIAAYLRVYGFVRRVIETTLRAAGVDAPRRGWGRLRAYVEKSDCVRAVLGRDHGNVFGIWDTAIAGDSEMLGWGMYAQGSYFNHNCCPNVRKQRVGRAMSFYASRDIMPGEELCITYIHVADPVHQRSAELKAEWYFDCACARCQRELNGLEVEADPLTSADIVGYIG